MTQPVKHWILQRIGGLGDVCMALCACQALRRTDPACVIWFFTSPRYARVAAACPFVDEVFTDPHLLEEALRETSVRGLSPTIRVLDSVQFGLDPLNQVEAYLASLQQPRCHPAWKSLVLEVPNTGPAILEDLPKPAPGKRRVVFHAAQGDPNRTWPKPSWEALGRRVLAEGHQLVLVGDRRSDPAKGAFRLDLPGAVHLLDCLEPLDLVALLRRSDVFLSTDSGPIQLAGATNVAICGIYTTVAGRCRIPFRHGQPLWGASLLEPECTERACYRFLSDPEQTRPYRSVLKQGGEALNQLFATWCVEKDRYHCLRDLTPGKAWEALEPWLLVTPRERELLVRCTAQIADTRGPTEALELLATLPALDTDFESLLLRARLLLQLRRNEEASACLRPSLALWPLHGAVLNMLGLGSLRAGQSKAARIFLDLAKNLPEAPEATTWNSTYLEALESLEGGDPEAAANALTRLHGLVPQRDTVDEADLMVLELTILMLQGRKADALSLSSQSVSRGLEHPDLCFLRGELQLQNGDLKEAALAFQACLSLDPTHTAAAERLASLT